MIGDEFKRLLIQLLTAVDGLFMDRGDVVRQGNPRQLYAAAEAAVAEAAERFRKGDFPQRYAAGEGIVADGSEGGRERDGSQPLVLRKGGLADGCHSFGNDGGDGVRLQRAHEAVGFDLVDGGSFPEKSEADAEMGALVGHIVDGERV